MSVALAIDLGGTKTLAALVDGARLVEAQLVPTDRQSGPEDWLQDLARRVRPWQGRYGAIGITVTGLVAEGRWQAMNPGTLAVPDGYPLADRAEAVLGGPVHLANDAQAAAWGEYRHGCGAGRDMIYLTVSTGIGAGIVLNGRLVTGARGLAGHAGQMLALPDGDDTPFEEVASGRFIAAQGGAEGAAEVFEAAARGDAAAEKAIALSAARVARLCRNLHLLLDTEVIVIGGGVGLAPGYLDRIKAQFSDLTHIVKPTLARAALGAEAGAIGIAALATNT